MARRVSLMEDSLRIERFASELEHRASELEAEAASLRSSRRSGFEPGTKTHQPYRLAPDWGAARGQHRCPLISWLWTTPRYREEFAVLYVHEVATVE
jgi:hypothetical protein